MTPLIVYGAVALTAHLNLGIRHVLPVYPFIYLLIGRAVTRFTARVVKPGAIVLGLGLAIENVVAFPNYIPFFNAIANPYRLHLLSDSNLDWGQDLIELAHWRQRNPTVNLYLAYFGSAPPQAYGIHAWKAAGGYFLDPDWYWPEEPGMIAISAVMLQGTDLPASLRKYYGQFLNREPREILGKSIYLYDVPQPPLPRPGPGR
jgi:hypothetical protein